MYNALQDGNLLPYGLLEHLFQNKAINPAVLFFDDFSEGSTLPWKITNPGTPDNSLALTHTTTAAEWNTGGAAMKLTTSTDSAEAAEVHRFIAKKPAVKGIYIFGGTFATMDENLSNIAFYLGFRDGTDWIRAKLLHNYSPNTWQWDAGGVGSASLQTLLTRDLSESDTTPRWHHFLMAADFRNNKYVTLQVDDQDFGGTVGGRPLRQAADTAIPNMMDFAIETTNTSGSPTSGVVLFDKLFGFVI